MTIFLTSQKLKSRLTARCAEVMKCEESELFQALAIYRFNRYLCRFLMYNQI